MKEIFILVIYESLILSTEIFRIMTQVLDIYIREGG